MRQDEQHVNITFGENQGASAEETKREMPIWMQQSTVAPTEDSTSSVTQQSFLDLDEDSNSVDVGGNSDEITSLLLKHERRGAGSAKAAAESVSASARESDSSAAESEDEDSKMVMRALETPRESDQMDQVDTMGSDDEDDDDGDIPTVKVGDEEITVTDVDEDIIAKMTTEEKERYTQIYQDFYSHMYD